MALKIRKFQWLKLIALVGNEGQDTLLDRLIATRSRNRVIGLSLCYLGPDARLLDAIDATGTNRSTLLNDFIERWCREIRSAAMSGRHRQAVHLKEPHWHGLSDPADGDYLGYWCLEAVAVAKRFNININDSRCLGHPHHPGDLRRPGTLTPPDVSRLPIDLMVTVEAVPMLVPA